MSRTPTRDNGRSPPPTPESPPLGPLLPAVLASRLYSITALVWVAIGDVLPGGRWLAVHLFTLGVVSNMVITMTHYFAQTLLHAPDRTVRLERFTLLNVGVALLVVGRPCSVSSCS